jgi:hypothetical protein
MLMESKLIVDRDSGLREFNEVDHQPQNPVIRIVAKVISYIFHPLFIPVYIALFVFLVRPHLFSTGPYFQKVMKLFRFIIMYTFFPLVTVLLAKGLGFLSSIYLKTQRDRVIPYIACGIYFFWMAYVSRHLEDTTPAEIQLTIAIFLTSSLGLIANIYMKVSMHAMSMGILVIFILMLATVQGENFNVYIAASILLAGIVCTSRLIVSDHTSKEIYTGLLIGAFSQLMAPWIDGILP